MTDMQNDGGEKNNREATSTKGIPIGQSSSSLSSLSCNCGCRKEAHSEKYGFCKNKWCDCKQYKGDSR